MKISIIIRSKNEERWVTSCLNAVFNQSFKDIEVILVDNNSTDMTVAKAKKFDVKVIQIDDYLPGKALNLGINVSKGEFIASLSAHCIPKDQHWLSNLLKNFDEEDIAGVYGRQEPLSYTNDLDKRDLYITFGLDRRVQIKDSFFHNANSMIRKSVWEKIPFNEEVINIEDRIWGQMVIDNGYKIIYEPEASVYHYHGIHQSGDIKRCNNIVKIMESLTPISKVEESFIDNLNITALIPVKGEIQYLCDRPLVEYAVKSAQQSKFIDKIVVSTDNPDIGHIAEKAGAVVPFIRPPYLSQPHVGIEEVLRYSLLELEEKRDVLPDLIVHLGVHAPFRPAFLIDNLIKLLVHNGFDSTLPGLPTYKSCWSITENGLKRIDEGFIARKVKKPIHIGYPGLACVTLTQFIREGRLLGDNVGIFELLDIFSTIEIMDAPNMQLAEKVFPEWWENQEKLFYENKRDATG